MITKWYVPEANSAAAIELRRRFQPPSMLTHLHRLELASAWQLKVFRGEMGSEAADRAAARLQSDIESGVWRLSDGDLDVVFTAALRLAREHTASLGTRSLDVLHVAAALALGDRDFVTGDERQGRLASVVGLRVTGL